MHKGKNLIQLLIALAIGCAGIIGTLLLLSQGAGARPLLDSDDLSISKSQSSDRVQIGDQLVYTLTYQNISTGTLMGVSITDTLDSHVAYAAASPPPTGGIPENTPYWSIGPLSTSTTGTIVLTVTVTGPLANGDIITNIASVNGNGAEPDTAQISATVDAPTLMLIKRDHADPVPAGGPLTYTLSYSNTGDANATNVVITDVLDSNVTYVSASPTPTDWITPTLYWNIGTLTPSIPGEIVVNVTVQGGLDEGDILTNSATIDSQQNTPFSVDETTVVSHGAPVSVSLTPASATVTTGLSISYTLTAFDTYANPWDVTSDAAYTITAGAGGDWVSNVYTAQVAGSWIVTGTLDGLADTALLAVTNGAPAIEDVTHSTPANEGSPITVTVTASDPENDTLTYGFDWDGNGLFTDAGDIPDQSSNQASHTWDDEGVYTITVRASDSYNTVTQTAAVTVDNVPPTITKVSNDGPVDEGSPATIFITATDPGSDALSYAYDWNKNGDFGDAGEDANSHTWDDQGAHIIAVQADDGDGGSVTATTTITVINVAPTITHLSNNSPVNENSLVIVTVSATDPGDDTVSYAYDWNEDGDFDDAGENYNFHTWGDDGIHAIAVRASDEDGGSVTQTTAITVENTPPVITDISNNSPVDENSPATIIVTAYDVGNDPLSYAYDWNEDGDFDDAGENVNSHTWNDDGVHPITVRVEDGDGGSVTDTTTITVVNVPPAITHLSNDGPVGEGSPATITVSATDPGDDTVSYAYDWNEDGDFDDAGESANSHTWYDESTHAITVRASDEDGGSVTATTTIVVVNVAPAITHLSNDGPVGEGSPATITLTATDPGTDTLSYAYDWNEDGDFDDAGEITPTHTWDDDGVHPITVRVDDGDGGSVTDTTTIVVVNVAPTITHLSNDGPVDEGAPVTVVITATDPGDDTISYAYDWNEDGDFDDAGETLNSHTWYDNGVHALAVRASDEDGGSVTQTAAITVVNVAPTITGVSNDGPVSEGSPATITITATDPGSDTLSYTYDWNEDGDFDDAGETSKSHTWYDEGTHPITVQVEDGDGGSVTDTTTITVVNVAPIVDAGPDQVVNEGEEVNFTGVLTDPGADSHDIVWDLGDGAFASATLTPTHVYSEPANLTVTLTITDEDGGVGSDTLMVTVENLAPNADAGGPYTGTAAIPLTMTASSSWDPGGGPLTYTWDLDDDGEYDDGDGEVVTYTWTAAGIHTVTVQVADAHQVTNTDSAQVSIGPAELNYIVLSPPTATIFAWETQTYTAEAFDVYSNSRGDVTTQTTFSIVESGHGGYWTDNVYFPQNHGDWTVRAVHTGTIVTTDTASLTILAPVMHLEKEDDPGVVEAGAILTYTLTYSNTGNLVASDVVITDTLDSNVLFAGANPEPDGGAPDAPYWYIGDVDPNGPSQIIVTATVARPLPNGTLLTNTAWLGADHVTPLPATEQTTVSSRPVLTISKESKPDPVVVGQNLVYTVIITNSGNENASSVTITEDYDPNTSFVYASLPPDPGSDNREWTFATLAVDDSIEMDIVVRVTDTLPVGTVLTNEVTLDSDQTVPISTTETTQVLSESDLEVTQIESPPEPAPAGDELAYIIHCENTGSAPATGTVITITYDSRVTYLGATPDPDVGNNVWALGTLAPGEGQYIMVEVDIDTPLPNGSVLANLVTIDSNNTAPVGFIETTPITSSTDLAFSVAQQPTDSVEAGAPLTYTLRYTNTGNASATQVVVTATFDSFAPFSSATPNPTGGTGDVRYWEIDVITGVNNYGEVNGVGEIVIQTDVTLPLTNGTPLSFTVQLEDAEGDFLEDAAYATVSSAPILSVDKDDGLSTVYAGDVLTYTITYTNSGNENAYDVVITDALPVSHTQYITCQMTGGTCQHVPANNEVIFYIPAIIAPTSGQAQIVLQVDDPLLSGAKLVTNRITMTHSSLAAPIGVQDVDLIGTLPDLTINATHDPSLFSPGELMTYTVTYGNGGRMHATGVTIATTLPPGTIYKGHGWTSSDGQTYTYLVGELPAGDTGNTIEFVVEYPGSEPQQIDATEFDANFTIAEGGSVGGDADPGNNSTNVYIGVPDLVVLDFTVAPLPLEPNAPVTFTITVENQGTGQASNKGGGGFWVDVFIAPVASYPYERYGEEYGGMDPIYPGQQKTLVIRLDDGFTEQEIEEIEEFYVKADNDGLHPYGLVPESNEMNNIKGPVNPSPSNYDIYLPLIQRNKR